jgi:hypothetical protein
VPESGKQGRTPDDDSSTGARCQELPLFRWEDIDHSLVRLSLIDLAEEMQHQIQADERRIQFGKSQQSEFERCGQKRAS